MWHPTPGINRLWQGWSWLEITPRPSFPQWWPFHMDPQHTWALLMTQGGLWMWQHTHAVTFSCFFWRYIERVTEEVPSTSSLHKLMKSRYWIQINKILQLLNLEGCVILLSWTKTSLSCKDWFVKMRKWHPAGIRYWLVVRCVCL